MSSSAVEELGAPTAPSLAMPSTGLGLAAGEDVDDLGAGHPAPVPVARVPVKVMRENSPKAIDKTKIAHETVINQPTLRGLEASDSFANVAYRPMTPVLSVISSVTVSFAKTNDAGASMSSYLLQIGQQGHRDRRPLLSIVCRKAAIDLASMTSRLFTVTAWANRAVANLRTSISC